jgi:hypothetical protein
MKAAVRAKLDAEQDSDGFLARRYEEEVRQLLRDLELARAFWRDYREVVQAPRLPEGRKLMRLAELMLAEAESQRRRRS